MINLQSPTYSSSTKFDIAYKLSPVFRNKRAPSCQDNYVTHWNRVNSCKKLDSPSKMSQKNRKRSHHSQQRVKSKINLSYNIVDQINTLKKQYTNIKIAYQQLIQSKVKNDEQILIYSSENKKLKQMNEKLSKDNEKIKCKLLFLEEEIDRIKKQSLKLIQIQHFKVKALEQNLIQKQRAIQKFKQRFKLYSSGQSQQLSIFPTNQSNDKILQNLDSSIYNIEPIAQQRTLTTSQFISVSLTSMMESQNTKRNKTNNSFCKGSLVGNKQKLSQGKEIQNKQNILQQPSDNFKKLRRQITKKIQVQIDDRNKETGTSKNMLDRKNSKSNKSSKSKLKKEDDSIEHRSSKKKIINK